MTLYNVHIYREMRLYFPGIEAATADHAAKVAANKPTDAAEYTEDCDGETLAAMIDVVGDDQFEKTVTVDFEHEKERKAASELLAALQAASDWINAQIFVPRTDIQATIQSALAKATSLLSERRPA
jgi:hypothetical protein